MAVGARYGCLRVRVRASGTNRIVEITCDSTQPEVASAFANTLTKEFIEQNLEARWKSTEYTGEWLTRQLQDIKIKLEKADEELNAYARSSGLTFTDEKTSVEEDKLRSLQKDLLQAQSDRVGKQSKFEMAVSSPPEALPDVLDDSALARGRNQPHGTAAQICRIADCINRSESGSPPHPGPDYAHGRHRHTRAREHPDPDQE